MSLLIPFATKEEITLSLEKGEQVKIASFGSWVPKRKGARVGRDLTRNKEVEIKPRTIVTFRASNIIRQAINCKDSG